MILNTLDRFFVRREQRPPEDSEPASTSSQPDAGAPSEPQAVQPPQAPGGPAAAAAAAAEPGTAALRAEIRKAGTLHGYLVRRDPATESSTDGRLADLELQRQPLPRSLMQRQITGRLDPAAAAYARHWQASRLLQLASLATHPWGRGALSAQGLVSAPPPGRDRAAAIQALQFDSGGELLVAGSDEGVVSVHSVPHLLQQLARGADGQLLRPAAAAAVDASADPLLLLDCGMPRLHSVRWDPRDQSTVGVSSLATRQLLLFDLEHTQGRPRQALSVPPQSASLGLAGSIAVGLTDIAFPAGSGASGCSGLSGSGGNSSGGGSSSSSSGGYTVMAGGMGGQVFLWDQRARSTPQASLHAQNSGAVNSLELVAGGWVVVAGTQSGEVKLWDLRGGSSGALRFGGAVHHHPLLDSFSLRLALTAVPGLADQTAIPASSVQWLQCDPRDERRLGFHLGCGWSGVLDLAARAITHLHAPPQPQLGGDTGAVGGTVVGISSEFAPAMHRRPCWSPCGSYLAVPARHTDALQLLDFAPSRQAAGAVPSGAEEELGASRSRSWAQPEVPPPAVDVQLSQPAVCAAAHPGGGLLVAGGRGAKLSVVASR